MTGYPATCSHLYAGMKWWGKLIIENEGFFIHHLKAVLEYLILTVGTMLCYIALFSYAQMIKILVIEDDYIWMAKLKDMLEELGFTGVRTCSTLSSARELLSEQLPDILIGDILLGQHTIFDLFRDMPHVAKLPLLLITVSGDGQFYQMSRHLPNVLYLVKPFHPLSIRASIDHLLGLGAKASGAEQDANIVVRGIYNERIPLSASQIVWVQAEGNYCVIQTTRQQYALKETLQHMEEMLGNNFVKVHRSAIVNRRFVQQADLRNLVITTTHGSFPIGRSHRLKVESILQGNKYA
jgi:DNA-binding LytR/AlgR family response regulator